MNGRFPGGDPLDSLHHTRPRHTSQTVDLSDRRAAPTARTVLVGLAVATLALAPMTPPAFGQTVEPTTTASPTLATGTPSPATTTATTTATTPASTNTATPASTTSPTASPLVTTTPAGTAAPSGTPQAAPALSHDERYFAETGYRVDDDQIWSYFNARGRVDVFGFPVSRPFSFLGCRTQIFQRQVAQVCTGHGPALLNLLDPEIFPYTKVNGSTFPAPDDALKNSTPRVDSPTYGTAIVDFVRTNAPDTFEGDGVNFGRTFFNSITAQQAGTNDPSLLPLMDLEVWGAPISRPQRDPANANFVYQRFQRGILHYERAANVTHGILLADYLKQLLLGPTMAGANLPADLTAQAQGSRFLGQYCPGQTGWLCRPADLPGTDLTFAFERDTTGPTAAATSSATPVASPAPSTTPAASPSATVGGTPATPSAVATETTAPLGTGTPGSTAGVPSATGTAAASATPAP